MNVQRQESELSKEFEVKVGVHQESMLSLLVFAIVVDMVRENVRNGLMSYSRCCTQMTWF